MSVIISGSSGIQNPLGSASAPSESNTTNSNTGAYFPTGTTYAVATNGTNALYIDASQNVGIGTTSPTRRLQVYQTTGDYQARLGYSDSYYYDFGRNATSGYFNFYGNQSGATGYIWGGVDGERMRIDSSGNLLINSTSNFSTSSKQFLKFDEQAQVGITLQSTNATTGGSYVYFVNSGGSVAGYIQHSGSATVAYVTSSDHRLKENVQPMTGALSKVAALKPVTYTWKEDGSKGEGFIAHELAEICPYAVAGEKDAVNEDGSIKPQGIDYGKIVVHLVAALQEAVAKIDALETEVTALKANVGA